MKYLFFFVSLFYSLQVLGQTATLSGNVFWKYNNFVGNRADAGSSVFINSLDDKFHEHTQTDLKGDFSFNNIPLGKVLIIVASNAVHKNPAENVQLLLNNRQALESANLFDFSAVENEIETFRSRLEEFELKEKIYNEKRFKFSGSGKAIKEYNKANKALLEISTKLITELVDASHKKRNENVLYLPVISAYTGLYIELVDLRKEGDVKIVVDFGITYI